MNDSKHRVEDHMRGYAVMFQHVCRRNRHDGWKIWFVLSIQENPCLSVSDILSRLLPSYRY